jgi:hypothetical protein
MVRPWHHENRTRIETAYSTLKLQTDTMALTHLFSRSVLGIPLSLMITLFAILAVAIYRYLISLRIPHINRHRNDWFGIKAKATFVARCSELLVEGRKRFGESPFMLTAMFGERLVLPEEWLGWVASHPDLDHQAHVAEVSYSVRR